MTHTSPAHARCARGRAARSSGPIAIPLRYVLLRTSLPRHKMICLRAWARPRLTVRVAPPFRVTR